MDGQGKGVCVRRGLCQCWDWLMQRIFGGRKRGHWWQRDSRRWSMVIGSVSKDDGGCTSSAKEQRNRVKTSKKGRPRNTHRDRNMKWERWMQLKTTGVRKGLGRSISYDKKNRERKSLQNLEFINRSWFLVHFRQDWEKWKKMWRPGMGSGLSFVSPVPKKKHEDTNESSIKKDAEVGVWTWDHDQEE